MDDFWWMWPVLVLLMLTQMFVLANHRGPVTKKDLEIMHFRWAYGASVERMVEDCPLDRDELRRMRDVSRSGRVQAIRHVRKWVRSRWRSRCSSSMRCEAAPACRDSAVIGT